MVSTNEVMLLLGENYFVETTAYDASAILHRRSNRMPLDIGTNSL